MECAQTALLGDEDPAFQKKTHYVSKDLCTFMSCVTVQVYGISTHAYIFLCNTLISTMKTIWQTISWWKHPHLMCPNDESLYEKYLIYLANSTALTGRIKFGMELPSICKSDISIISVLSQKAKKYWIAATDFMFSQIWVWTLNVTLVEQTNQTQTFYFLGQVFFFSPNPAPVTTCCMLKSSKPSMTDKKPWVGACLPTLKLHFQLHLAEANQPTCWNDVKQQRSTRFPHTAAGS